MPTPVLKSLAKRAGVSLPDAEKDWEKAKHIAQGMGVKPGSSDFWATVTGVTKKLLRRSKKESRVLLGVRDMADGRPHIFKE